MKVLIVGMTKNPGGIETVVMNYVRNADPGKVRFDILSTSPYVAYEDELLKRGSRVVHIPIRHEHPITFRKELNSFMDEHAAEYDVIWVHMCSLVNIDFLKAAYAHGIPRRIIHCHNSQNMWGGFRNIIHTLHRGQITKYATDYWTCSEDAVEWFYGDGIKDNPRYAYIPNAINPDDVAFDAHRRVEVRAAMGWDGKVVLGNVARLHPQKNQSYLLHALAPVLGPSSNVLLVIVGDGVLHDELRQEADVLGIADNVQFLGLRDDMHDLYQGMDAFVLPSKFEGVSIAFLEAQANGLPCLVSDTLSDEGIVNDNVMKLPITSDGEGQWVSAVRQLDDSGNRTQHPRLKGSKHDIHEQMKMFYSRLQQ